MITGSLGTEGNLLRIAVRDIAAPKLLRLKMKPPIFYEVIKRELKAEDKFSRKRFNLHNNFNRLNNSNGYNAFRRGYYANTIMMVIIIIIPEGSFFRREEKPICWDRFRASRLSK
jgi:hypothetical protein